VADAAQLRFDEFDVTERRIILTRVSDVETDQEFGAEEEVEFHGRGVVREVRVRTKDGLTRIQNLIVMRTLSFEKDGEVIGKTSTSPEDEEGSTE
jgi:hypothetical protein